MTASYSPSFSSIQFREAAHIERVGAKKKLYGKPRKILSRRPRTGDGEELVQDQNLRSNYLRSVHVNKAINTKSIKFSSLGTAQISSPTCFAACFAPDECQSHYSLTYQMRCISGVKYGICHFELKVFGPYWDFSTISGYDTMKRPLFTRTAA